MLELTDHHGGRLIDAIDDLGVLDNTIIYCIVGDNGVFAEGTLNGGLNEMAGTLPPVTAFRCRTCRDTEDVQIGVESTGFAVATAMTVGCQRRLVRYLRTTRKTQHGHIQPPSCTAM